MPAISHRNAIAPAAGDQAKHSSSTRWAISSEQLQKRKQMRMEAYTCITILTILILVGISITVVIVERPTTSTTMITTVQTTTTTTTTTTAITTITQTTTTTTITTTTTPTTMPGKLQYDSTWNRLGVVVAGGTGNGNRSDQLHTPRGMAVDPDDGTVYVADSENHRIVRWKPNATEGEVVAGGNGKGNRTDQLFNPVNVCLDKRNQSLVICEPFNRRVVRWSLRNPLDRYIIVARIDCYALALDKDGAVYISDVAEETVVRWLDGETRGTTVAGGNGRGADLNQIHRVNHLFVDEHYSVYVSDHENHRVIKWSKGASEGIVVAGGNGGRGNDADKVVFPQGLFVDTAGSVYVAELTNDRITRWPRGATQGTLLIDRHGHLPTQLDGPSDLSFDREGNLYVMNAYNSLVMKFYLNQ